MIERWRQHAGAFADRLDGDEEGAIFLAALAALMVLIMVGLVIWDAGTAAKDKIDLQNAADTAAYSQASVRARSMNMLAFTNVAKREVVGLHSMYYGMFTGFAIWLADRCKTGQNAFADDARLDCNNNEPLRAREGGTGGEWNAFTGRRYGSHQEPLLAEGTIMNQMYASQPTTEDSSPLEFNPGVLTTSKHAFGHEVMALDDYQRYLVEITPWWAWTQALVRGIRNGADAAATFPLPENGTAIGGGWIGGAVGAMNGDATHVEDFDVSCEERDERNEPDKLLSRARPQAVPGDFQDPTVDLELFEEMAHESCLPLQTGARFGVDAGTFEDDVEDRSPITDPLQAAVSGDVDLHERLSNADADHPIPLAVGLLYAVESAPPGLLRRPDIAAGGGCWWSTFLFTNVSMNNRDPSGAFVNPECDGERGTYDSRVRFYSVPYSLGANDNSSDALMARSNIVFSYRHTPERATEVLGGEVRGAGDEATYRNILEDSSYAVDNPGNPIYSSEGYWSMARAEIVYPHLEAGNDPSEAGAPSARGLWLFRPGWTAKLRPMALPGEWQGLNYNLTAAFDATDPFFELAEEMDIFDGAANVPDNLEFMHRSTQTLDSRMEGIAK